MACTLPFRNSKENSKYFLESIDAIDSEGLILDKELFNEAVDQLEKETIQAYNIQGKHWFENVLPTEPILPNEEVFKQIDNKRKQLGVYDSQQAGQIIGEETEILLPDEHVQYKFKVINALQSNKVREPKLDNLQGFYNDLQKQGIPTQQIDLVKDVLSEVKGKVTKEYLIRELLVRYSYSVEIETAMVNSEARRIAQREDIDYEDAVGYAKTNNQTPASYYSNLTVPGGTNYTENEIKTPGIVPVITGHAEFSTKEGIGWFRSDDKGVEILDKYIPTDDTLLKEYKEFEYPFSFEEYRQSRLNNISVIPEYTTNSKIRRILEVQSDWGQKQRKSFEPDINIKYDIQQITNDLQKSGDLKIDCN